MTRILGFVVAVLLGTAGGLALGWLVLPANGATSTADSLRIDYKADYVLMAAEAFAADKNLDQAASRLAVLGGASPVVAANQAVLWANQHGYPAEDLRTMANLAAALRSWAPPAAGGQP